MHALETAIALSQLSRIRFAGRRRPGDDHLYASRREAARRLLALVAAFAAFGFFILALDGLASRQPAAEQRASYHSQYGANR